MAEPATGDAASAAADLVADGGAAALAALRAAGLAERDPLRLRFLEALARRAAAQQGAARQTLVALLARRLAEARAALAAATAPSASAPRQTAAPAAAGRAALADLAALLHRLQQAAPSGDAPPPAPAPGPARAAPAMSAEGAQGTPGAAAPPLPELKALRAFRSSWTRLSVQQRLRQSQARLPGNAGPLNAQALALRTLQTLEGLSPAYLACLVSQLDTLGWLEQASGDALPPPRDVLRSGAGTPRRASRGRAG